MKKLTLSLVLAAALCSTSAFAKTSNSDTMLTPLSGAYIGAYGGYDWSGVDSSGPDANLKGWDGGVFAGYKLDAMLDHMNGMGIGLNGALEGFYGWSNSDDTVAGVSVDKNNEWGISFRPGFSLLDKIGAPLGLNPYGIIGYRNTEFEGSTGTANASKRYDGFELGIGTELVAYGDWGVRAEYSHVWYRSEAGFDPDADDVRVGLAYHF